MQEFSDIEAVILDKDGVFVSFDNLWLRIIAYRAQIIAEESAETSPMLVSIRNACIRAMGVDEDTESIDPDGPCAMPEADIRTALATALYITKIEHDPSYKWKQAFTTVDSCIARAHQDLNHAEMSEPISGSVEKIKELSEQGFKLGVFTADDEQNAEAALEKFAIKDLFSGMQAGEFKTSDNYSALCKRMSVDPKKTLLVSDSPHDIKVAKEAGAKTIAVLSGVVEESKAEESFADHSDSILKSLAELKLDGKKKVVA